jgi:four helix bundle protein
MNAGGVDKACKSCGATANFQLLTTHIMTFRYRNFKVYQDAIGAYKFIILVTKNFSRDFDHVKDQIRRAALSVILNIAEGSAKNSDKDFNRYLGNSLGSVNEVMAGLEVSYVLNLLTKEDFTKGGGLYELIANQLGGFSKKLKS